MVQDDEDTKLRVCVVWNDDSQTWLDADEVRGRCPQKLLDFFISHLKWRR